jgi:hypothetical protein
MPTGDKSQQKRVRLRAGQEPGVGDTRYQLIRSAARRISQAIKKGYWLEAVTLVESMLTERLEKRAQYLHDHLGQPTASSLAKVKDGFANLGPLIIALKDKEPDHELQAVLKQVDQWRSARNIAVHEMAKFGTGARQPWDDRMERARQIAKDGIGALVAYDRAERRVCHEGRKRRQASATYPDALGPIGQEICRYCLPEREVSSGRTGAARRRSSSAARRYW